MSFIHNLLSEIAHDTFIVLLTMAYLKWGKGKPLYWYLRLKYRLRGWKKVDSPWPLFEKQYRNGIRYQALNWEGCDLADKRYSENKDPLPRMTATRRDA